MPMDNAEATEVSAEMSALLAYVLCQKVDSTVQASSMSMADENVARSYSSTIGMMSYNVGYRVLRKEVAADGTVWVALKCYDDAAATLWLTMRVNWEGEEQIDNGKTDVLNCSTLKMTYSNGTNRCVLQAQTNVEIHQDSDENQFIVLLQTDRAQGSYSGSLDAAPQGVDKKALKKRETDLREVGFNFAEVPFVAPPRFAGESKYSLKKMVKLAVDGIVGYSVLPLRTAFAMGIFLAVLSCCFMLHALYVYINGEAVSGWTTIMVCMSLFGGAQLIILGIMGEYLGRIYTEVKNRPLYLIKNQEVEK